MFDLSKAPPRILALPRDPVGAPIPWWLGDGPGSHHNKFNRAIAAARCWICGDRLGSYLSFVIDPPAAITRLALEPPSHIECATFAVVHAPHTMQPITPTDVWELGEKQTAPVAIWTTRHCEPTRSGATRRITPTLQLGEPITVAWYYEGRSATRAEIDAAIARELPELRRRARAEGLSALRTLEEQLTMAERLLPPKPAPAAPEAAA